MASLKPKAQVLLDAHQGPDPLVLPNIWDVTSARTVAAAGFPVIATSSRAIAGVFGFQDNDSSNPDSIFNFLTRIAEAVSLPVTADLEAGYGLVSEELVGRIFAAGLVGCNLEDTDHHGDSVLIDANEQAGFIARVRAASDSAGIHLVINARVDSFIRQVGNDDQQLEDAVRRGRLYLEAGADCIYPIALVDRERIARLTDSLSGPVNVVARKGGMSIKELASLGVRRISFASALFQSMNDQLRRAALRLAESKNLDSVWQAMPATSR
ncbi:MAG: isocitrate lyase/phosphoenolpyruvate mutase family protein [Actinomycetota bacterium]|nr:MAG: isocitrate lyase/phosphoenolpyruvate mutase family protein [Actinomycetota bacterium]